MYVFVFVFPYFSGPFDLQQSCNQINLGGYVWKIENKRNYLLNELLLGF